MFILLVRIQDMEYIPLESFEFGICAEMQEYLNGLGKPESW